MMKITYNITYMQIRARLGGGDLRQGAGVEWAAEEVEVEIIGRHVRTRLLHVRACMQGNIEQWCG